MTANIRSIFVIRKILDYEGSYIKNIEKYDKDHIFLSACYSYLHITAIVMICLFLMKNCSMKNFLSHAIDLSPAYIIVAGAALFFLRYWSSRLRVFYLKECYLPAFRMVYIYSENCIHAKLRDVAIPPPWRKRASPACALLIANCIIFLLPALVTPVGHRCVALRSSVVMLWSGRFNVIGAKI